MRKFDRPWVLGVSASHNGAVCLLRGDEIVVAIQEERLTRSKRSRIYGAEPSLSIPYCLNYAGIDLSDIHMLVLCVAGSANHPSQNFRLNSQLRDAIRKIPVLRIPHHFGHAMSAFAVSGFDECAVLVVDGMGSPYQDLFKNEQGVLRKKMKSGSEIISLYAASGASLRPLEKHIAETGKWLEWRGDGLPYFRSLGGLFSSVAYQIFGHSMESGKVMGLAPYGVASHSIDEFFDLRRGELIFHNRLHKKFKHNQRWPSCEEEYSNLSCSAQIALEAGLMSLLKRLRDLCPSENLCYAGGVALNSVANERIIREAGFRRVFIPPAAEDSGPAVGAAYYGLWQLTGENARQKMTRDAFGCAYPVSRINAAVGRAKDLRTIRSKDVISDTVELLCAGMVVGWFDGCSELGPRALGQRSILYDPRRRDGKSVLNRQVKKRESFRPFAPAILREEVENWFEWKPDEESPFMLRVGRFRPEKASSVPGVVHVDGSGRLQTLTKRANGRFYDLVHRFYERTGVPILLNTSFNVMGEPIVESPEDALRCLLSSGLDCCVFEDRIVYKRFLW